MKTSSPTEMLKDVTGEITDAVSLLEFLYKNTDNDADTDSGLSCIIRSLLSTIDKSYGYIEQISIKGGDK